MLTISASQIETLKQAAIHGFIGRTVRHVETHFHKHWLIVGEAQVRVVIRLAVERAARHGFTSERDVCLYLNLMLLLGSTFDADIQLAWVPKTLADGALTDRTTRIDRLYDAAMAYLNEVAGKQDEHFQQALERMVAISQRKLPVAPNGDFGTKAMSLLEWLYPQKFEVVGTEVMRTFLIEATQAAKAYGVVSHEQAMLYVGMAYMLGSSFDRDPQFPWAGELLRDASISNPAARFDRLRTESVSMLSRWASASGS